MNKKLKVIIATLGAVDVIFSIFIPISVALLILNIFPNINWFSRTVLLIAGMLSTLYKAINVAGIDLIEYIFKSISKKK